jgi:L-histidine N-alpha-methyltransferase
MTGDDWFLLGTDLVKDTDRLVQAYDDAAGITASFNKNVLAVLNRDLGAEFDLSTFRHVACWNSDEQWIEMRLRSTREQEIPIAELGSSIAFSEGEEVLTEISAKFTIDRLGAELAAADLAVAASYLDPDRDFLLTLAHPYR